jgi:hypothetical protein
MKKRLALVAALGAVFLFATVSLSAAKMEVKGVINDWPELKNKIPASAFFQVVKLEEKLQGTTDAQGFSAFNSELPKIQVRADGSFRVDLKDAPPGQYFIALQRAIPKEMAGESMATAIPILINKEGPLVIEVPGKFPLDVGQVDVAVRGPEKS